jgi:integrase
MVSRRSQDTCFVKYFEQLAQKRAGTNHDNWHCALAHFKDFAGNSIRMADVTEKFCNDFREYMLEVALNQRTGEPLAVNTASGYFNKLKATLKQAYSDKLLLFDLNRLVPVIKAEETHRESLELDELRTLAQTECAMPVLKQAGLFSALTGLRFSDIHAMTWGQLRPATGGGYNFHFKQKKMKRVEYLPISEDAVNLCGPRGADDAKVFQKLVYSSIHKPLKDWIAASGVTRHISFHCFRHTFACLQLELGSDLYVVSKMITHTDIKTTQIYGKVRDKAKREAANRIKL